MLRGERAPCLQNQLFPSAKIAYTSGSAVRRRGSRSWGTQPSARKLCAPTRRARERAGARTGPAHRPRENPDAELARAPQRQGRRRTPAVVVVALAHVTTGPPSTSALCLLTVTQHSALAGSPLMVQSRARDCRVFHREAVVLAAVSPDRASFLRRHAITSPRWRFAAIL